MTLEELSQLYYLNREIEMGKRRLRELEAKALPGAQVLTGMPHPPGVKDKVGDYAAEIADLRGIIEAKYQHASTSGAAWSATSPALTTASSDRFSSIGLSADSPGGGWPLVSARGIPRTDVGKLCNGIWSGTRASCPFCPLHNVL